MAYVIKSSKSVNESQNHIFLPHVIIIVVARMMHRRGGRWHLPAISPHRRFPCGLQASSCPLLHIVDPGGSSLFWFVFLPTSPSSVRILIFFVVSAALAVISLQTHQPIVGLRHSSSSRSSLFRAYGATPTSQRRPTFSSVFFIAKLSEPYSATLQTSDFNPHAKGTLKMLNMLGPTRLQIVGSWPPLSTTECHIVFSPTSQYCNFLFIRFIYLYLFDC